MATLLICIQRKRAPFSTTGSLANTTREEEALVSVSAGLSLNATETAAARARGTQSRVLRRRLEQVGYHNHDLKRQRPDILMLAADAACTQWQDVLPLSPFTEVSLGVTHQPSHQASYSLWPVRDNEHLPLHTALGLVEGPV